MNVKRSGLLWELYPEFKRREIFCTLPKAEAYGSWSLEDVSDLGKCVVAYSDPEGPVCEERDIQKRLEGAIDYIGVSKSDKVGKEVMETGRLFLDMTHRYYEMIHGLDYELWLSYKMQLHNFMSLMRSPVSSDKATDISARRSLMKEVEEMSLDVMRIEAKVFDDMTLMKKVAERLTGKDEVEGYAEDFAVSIDDLLETEYTDIFKQPRQ